MSLKRRDLIAYLLILAAALAWTAGQKILNRIPGTEDDAAVTTTFSSTRREESHHGIYIPQSRRKFR